MSATTRCLPALLALALAGCPDANPLDGIKTQIEVRKEVPVIIGGIEAEKAVQTYVATHGENPPSIEALEASVGKLKAPPYGKAYSYDPATGRIELVDAGR